VTFDKNQHTRKLQDLGKQLDENNKRLKPRRKRAIPARRLPRR